MSDNNKTIHDFDFNLICEYFSQLERQGPGSPEATLRALGFIDNLTEASHIADLGCGTGGQTMTLAAAAPGHITAIDLFPGFIARLNGNARQLGYQDKVQGVVGSMDDLPFGEGELDLIWSEGAIYNIGFERGLREWNRYLKPGGYVAVTEATWFTPDRPEEIERFWTEAYPEIDTIPHNIALVERAGYMPVAMFTLGEQCWIDNFYAPQTAAREAFLAKNRGNTAAMEFIAGQIREQELYMRYKEFYGYVFYIARKL